MDIKPYKLITEIIVTPSKDGKSVDVKQLFVCDYTKCPKAVCENSNCYQTADIDYAQRFEVR